MYDPLCPQPNNLPSPGAPPPSPAFVLITTTPEQMVLCFVVTDVRSPPIAASETADWLGQRQVFFIISLLHLQEQRAAATKRRNIGADNNRSASGCSGSCFSLQRASCLSWWDWSDTQATNRCKQPPAEPPGHPFGTTALFIVYWRVCLDKEPVRSREKQTGS